MGVFAESNWTVKSLDGVQEVTSSFPPPAFPHSLPEHFGDIRDCNPRGAGSSDPYCGSTHPLRCLFVPKSRHSRRAAIKTEGRGEKKENNREEGDRKRERGKRSWGIWS